MVDPTEGYLYKFFAAGGADGGNPSESQDNLAGKKVRFASTQGYTSQAIADREVKVILNGKNYTSRAAEVDKVVKIASIDNVMIGPCFDSDG